MPMTLYADANVLIVATARKGERMPIPSAPAMAPPNAGPGRAGEHRRLIAPSILALVSLVDKSAIIAVAPLMYIELPIPATVLAPNNSLNPPE